MEYAKWGVTVSTKQCDACGAVVTLVGHRDFGRHVCPKTGTDATSPDHKACPQHGSLVWRVGPYSSYRACGHKGTCTAGKRGKQWRYCAPRGAGVSESANDDSDTNDAANDTKDTYIVDEVKEYAVQAVKATTTPPAGIDLKALGTLGDAIQAYVDARAIQLASEVVYDAMAKLTEAAPRSINWTVNDKPFAKVEGTHHKMLPRLLKLYAAGFRNFLIVGPAGSGKTTIARDLATALEVSFGSVSCTAGMSESALTGRAIPNLSTGETSFQSTDFVRCYEAGGVFLIDETDAADPNVMLVINSALANDHMPLPNRDSSPSATRHEQSIIVCAANTWGTGADRQYVGRNQMDAAFLDRFVGATIEVDYDRDLESSLVGDANICARVWTIRGKVMDLKLRRVVGTRFLLAVTRLVKSAGETVDAALTACTVGWTADERSKAGVA